MPPLTAVSDVIPQEKYDTTASKDVLPEDPAFDNSFRPVGAMAFFALFVLLGVGIWFAIYFLMLHRI